MIDTGFVKQTDWEATRSLVNAIISGEPDMIANMANISAILWQQLDCINWVGFYRVTNQELVLGPFQGKPACIRIPLGRGVCGTSADTGKLLNVNDVHEFDGHIACDAASNSEIVIPLIVDGEVVAVLDIDSPEHNRFLQIDEVQLQYLVDDFAQLMSNQ